MKGAHADIKLNTSRWEHLNKSPARMQMLLFVFSAAHISVVSKWTFSYRKKLFNLIGRGIWDIVEQLKLYTNDKEGAFVNYTDKMINNAM